MTRDCFHAYASKFQDSASLLVKYLDSRTQRLLMESKPAKGSNGYTSHRDSLEDDHSWSSSRPLKVRVPKETEVHRSPKYSPIRLNEDNSISPKRSDMLKPSPCAERARQFSSSRKPKNKDASLSPPNPDVIRISSRCSGAYSLRWVNPCCTTRPKTH